MVLTKIELQTEYLVQTNSVQVITRRNDLRRMVGYYSPHDCPFIQIAALSIFLGLQSGTGPRALKKGL